MSTDLNIPKKRHKIEWKRSFNFLIALLLIYVLFFGFIVNTGNYQKQEDPGIKLLYVYTAFFNTDKLYIGGLSWPDFMSFIWQIPCWVCIFILFIIGIIQSYREDFVVYAIKNNIWTIPFIVVISWFWYTCAYFGHPLIAQAAALPMARFFKFFVLIGAYIATFIINFVYTIGKYFSSIHALLNIVVLLVVYVSAGMVGSALKCYFYQRAHPIIELQPTAMSTVPNLEVN